MSILSYPPVLLAPSADFWSRLARALAEHDIVRTVGPEDGDLSGIRVVVPGCEHAELLKAALAAQLQRRFIAPRITTLPAWLAQLPPETGHQDHRVQRQAGASIVRIERMMALYAEMRRHPWLKRLFHAPRNTDLLPVAHSLLQLFDELSEVLLPALQVDGNASAEEWRAALAQLSPPAHGILSDEARLVWTLWQGQFDRDDPAALVLARLRRLAAVADAPLVWIGGRPQPLHDAFLEAYARRCPVLPVMAEWHVRSLAPIYAAAWPEVLDDDEGGPSAPIAHAGADPCGSVFLHAARSLEDEAGHAAQTVMEWLGEGKTRIAVIAQDPAAARRLQALLARAGIVVADRTERKWSATRAAATLAALLEVVATRAGSFALLDLLKCPGLCDDLPGKAELAMQVELALRRANVLGGWNAVLGAVAGQPEARALLLRIAGQAWRFTGRRSLSGWARLTQGVLRELGLRDAMEAEEAGARVPELLDGLACQDGGSQTKFGFAEWRAVLRMQLESMPCLAGEAGQKSACDARVVMLPLGGAPLRRFDAVIMVGADAAHLPSPAAEATFFADHVRRELGLTARDAQQRMQLRDFAELLNAGSETAETVLCWQATRGGEPNAASPWIERLQLALEQAGRPGLRAHHAVFPERRLRASPPRKPSPAAPELLPDVLSATAYNSLMACPYQFFATSMLGLASLDELEELPEKRDYGGWLHAILHAYHEAIRDDPIGTAERERLLRTITDQVFSDALAPGSAAPGALALGYYARWLKAIPAYLEWAGEREAAGWKFVSGEQTLERVLEWEGGRIILRGRVDRVDEHPDGSRAILDYKAQGLQALRDRLRDGEDHRLAFCAVLSEAPVTSGHLVALDPGRNRAGDAAAEHFIEWQDRLESQVVRSMQAIAAGASLPAAGIERICMHCEVRGLCRKGAW